MKQAVLILPTYNEKENIESLIIGNGPEKENLLKLAKELKVSDRLHLLGFIDEEKKFQYLDNSDVYVLSSLHEGFGIVLQEAMQIGLPIVATNNGGQVDFIKNGKNGFLVNVGDEKVLSKTISKLIKKSLRYNNLIEKFSLKTISGDYLRLK